MQNLDKKINKNTTVSSKLFTKSDCYGCRACQHICPTKAIHMEVDEEGFIYPKIDNELCIYCSKCMSLCPANEIKEIETKSSFNGKAYVAYLLNNQERGNSQSGGAFVAISDTFLEENGIIYGVALDKNLTAQHMRATSIHERNLFCGSKYVQSNTGHVYKEVYNDIKLNKKVLFTGTACQIAGLYSYLSSKGIYRDDNRLLTVDIVCHGVVSPKVWRDNVRYIIDKLGSKPEIVKFRDKSFGWGTYIESYSNADKRITSTLYTTIFYEHVFLRPSCYSCPYASLDRISDITIADAWGVSKIFPQD